MSVNYDSDQPVPMFKDGKCIGMHMPTLKQTPNTKALPLRGGVPYLRLVTNRSTS